MTAPSRHIRAKIPTAKFNVRCCGVHPVTLNSTIEHNPGATS